MGVRDWVLRMEVRSTPKEELYRTELVGYGTIFILAALGHWSDKSCVRPDAGPQRPRHARSCTIASLGRVARGRHAEWSVAGRASLACLRNSELCPVFRGLVGPKLHELNPNLTRYRQRPSEVTCEPVRTHEPLESAFLQRSPSFGVLWLLPANPVTLKHAFTRSQSAPTRVEKECCGTDLMQCLG